VLLEGRLTFPLPRTKARTIRQAARWLATVDSHFRAELRKAYGVRAETMRYAHHELPRLLAVRRIYHKAGRQLERAWNT